MTSNSYKVVVSYINPPIPYRDRDYCAYRENDVEDSSKYGYGRTAWEAMRDLADILDDEEMEQERGVYLR